MNTRASQQADILIPLAESKFHRWLERKFHPARKQRFNGLEKKNLTFGGWALQAIRADRELLAWRERKRIGIYKKVARDSGNSEMLSTACLIDFRNRILTTLEHAIAALKGQIERAWTNRGTVSPSALPSEGRYVQIRSEILGLVNAEIGVLEAEGNLFYRESTSPASASGKRGPKPDHQKASRVVEVVARVAPDGGWRSKWEEVAEALDKEGISCPKTWTAKDKTCKLWADQIERSLVVKAVEYRLTRADR